MLNNISLIGRLCADPTSQYTSGGVALAKFRVACDRGMKDPETGERTADFFDVVCWRQTAEFVTQYITKGRLVSLAGRIQSRNWVAQDGSKRTAVEIIAERVHGLDRPKDEAREDSVATVDAHGSADSTAARNDLDDLDDLDEADPFAD